MTKSTFWMTAEETEKYLKSIELDRNAKPGDMTFFIEPIYDSEDELWFAGTYTGLANGPIGQRSEFFAWPSPQGGDGAQAYKTRAEACDAAFKLNGMLETDLRKLAPEFF